MIIVHGLGSSVIDYVIYDIHIYNQIITRDLLNDHEPDFDHIPLTLTINFVIHKIHWGIKEEVSFPNNGNIKNIFTSKFKEKLLCDKELKDKIKLRYYKEWIKSNLEDKKISLYFD
jgi:hypothetical protein